MCACVARDGPETSKEVSEPAFNRIAREKIGKDFGIKSVEIRRND